MEEVSWALKLKLLKDYAESKTTEHSRSVGLQAFVIGSNGDNEFIRNNAYLSKNQFKSMKIGQNWSKDVGSYLTVSSGESPRGGRRQAGGQTPTKTPPDGDENSMRMKLFRLMYETVRDSDLKVKRAELIKSHYKNSSVFDIGFIMGDITDKFNVITDISTTLKRLYHEWKPIEHINAYEQIANQAIEIGHLIDMMRHIGKRSNTTL